MILLKFLSQNLVKNRLKFSKFLSTQNPYINGSDNCKNNDESALTFDHFKSLAINKKIEYKIKIILDEYHNYRNNGENRDRVPSKLTMSQMAQLLECNKAKRKGRLWMDLSVKERKHLFHLMRKCEESNDWNRLIEPFLPHQFDNLYKNRLKNAALFGQNIVFDFSFDSYMSTLECKNLAEQFHRIYKFNRYECLKYSSGELPFNLNLCNVDKSGKTFKFVEFLYPELISDKSFVNISSKSYLDLFSKQDLIYLSPHADEVMIEYDNSAVFIIGGIVDRKEVLTLSQPKAVQQNIRSLRLPIDSLTAKTNIQSLDSVFRVLFDFKVFGVNNEFISFEDRIRRHIPKFKLKSVEQTAYERFKTQELNSFSDFNDCEEISDLKSN